MVSDSELQVLFRLINLEESSGKCHGEDEREAIQISGLFSLSASNLSNYGCQPSNKSQSFGLKEDHLTSNETKHFGELP